jgi:DNA-binding LacI/PurR family transcriptional regulator
MPAEYKHEEPGGGPENGLAAVDYFLRLSPRPTAIVCYHDMMATGVLKGLQSAGVNVPQELSVTGFDNIVFSAFTNPSLTTFDQPKRFIGSEAARLVLELLNIPLEDGSGREPVVQTLQGKLLVRQSTAAAPLSLTKEST